MLASFSGTHELKMDGKGRMSVPADFRRVLEANDADFRDGDLPRMRLLYGPHLRNHLVVYSLDAYADVVRRLEALPEGEMDTTMAFRMIVGMSMQIDIDKDGRIVMPQKQREKLGLPEGGEVVLTGAGRKFEIWSAVTYQSSIADQMEAWLEAKGPDFDPMRVLNRPPGA